MNRCEICGGSCMTSPCRGCKMSGKTAPRVEAIRDEMLANQGGKSIDSMSDAEILEECATYMALKNGPIHGLALQQAKDQSKATLSRLPITHVKIMLESAMKVSALTPKVEEVKKVPISPEEFKWKVKAAKQGNILDHYSLILFENGTVVTFGQDEIGDDEDALKEKAIEYLTLNGNKPLEKDMFGFYGYLTDLNDNFLATQCTGYSDQVPSKWGGKEKVKSITILVSPIVCPKGSTPDYMIEMNALGALSKDVKGKRAIYARIRYGSSKTECQDHYYEDKNFEDSDDESKSEEESEDELEVELCDAAYRKNLALVKIALDSGASPNCTESKKKGGASPIWYAANEGRLDIIELLLSRGGSINHANLDGGTALHGAAGAGHLEVCKFLLSKGADINAICEDEFSGPETPAQTAASSGWDECEKFLKDYKPGSLATKPTTSTVTTPTTSTTTSTTSTSASINAISQANTPSKMCVQCGQTYVAGEKCEFEVVPNNMSKGVHNHRNVHHNDYFYSNFFHMASKINNATLTQEILGAVSQGQNESRQFCKVAKVLKMEENSGPVNEPLLLVQAGSIVPSGKYHFKLYNSQEVAASSAQSQQIFQSSPSESDHSLAKWVVDNNQNVTGVYLEAKASNSADSLTVYFDKNFNFLNGPNASASSSSTTSSVSTKTSKGSAHTDRGIVGAFAPNRLERIEILMFSDPSSNEAKDVQSHYFPDSLNNYIKIKLLLSSLEADKDVPVGFDSTLPHEVVENIMLYLLFVKQTITSSLRIIFNNKMPYFLKLNDFNNQDFRPYYYKNSDGFLFLHHASDNDTDDLDSYFDKVDKIRKDDFKYAVLTSSEEPLLAWAIMHNGSGDQIFNYNPATGEQINDSFQYLVNQIFENQKELNETVKEFKKVAHIYLTDETIKLRKELLDFEYKPSYYPQSSVISSQEKKKVFDLFEDFVNWRKYIVRKLYELNAAAWKENQYDEEDCKEAFVSFKLSDKIIENIAKVFTIGKYKSFKALEKAICEASNYEEKFLGFMDIRNNLARLKRDLDVNKSGYNQRLNNSYEYKTNQNFDYVFYKCEELMQSLRDNELRYPDKYPQIITKNVYHNDTCKSGVLKLIPYGISDCCLCSFLKDEAGDCTVGPFLYCQKCKFRVHVDCAIENISNLEHGWEFVGQSKTIQKLTVSDKNWEAPPMEINDKGYPICYKVKLDGLTFHQLVNLEINGIPEVVKIATAWAERLEKDLPAKPWPYGQTYVPYKIGERFKIICDNQNTWYEAMRESDGKIVYIQRSLFTVKIERSVKAKATTKQIAVASYGKLLNRLPPQPWGDKVYIPWVRGNKFEVLSDDITAEDIYVKRLVDGVKGYIGRYSCIITTHPIDEVIEDREPFICKVGTAKWQRLEKDLPPKDQWGTNTYVPLEKGDRFQIVNDNIESWYNAVRLRDGMSCLVQKNFFAITEETAVGPEFVYVPTPQTEEEADAELDNLLAGLDGL